MVNGEWIMVNGEFLTRIMLILRMAPIGKGRGRVLVPGTFQERNASILKKYLERMPGSWASTIRIVEVGDSGWRPLRLIV